MLTTDSLRVKPITYKLDINDEELKKMRPFFKLQSGSYSRITKTIRNASKADPQLEDEVKLRRKEKGSVIVELWDRNSSRPENLIGKGELKYNSLSSHEGEFEEWISLYDNKGKKVGKALVEIKILPVNKNLSIDDIFKSSITDMDRSFKRAIENMNSTFEDFGGFALPGFEFPRLALSSGPQQQAITQGSDVGRPLSPKSEKRNQIMTHRRSLFDDTFSHMNNMFEKTIEDMHNMFEDFTKDVFPSGLNWLEDEDKDKNMEVENESKPQIEEKERESKNASLRERSAKGNSKQDVVEIHDEPPKA